MTASFTTRCLPSLLGVALLILAGCSGDGDGDSPSPLEPPAFDLTGIWQITSGQCEPDVDDLDIGGEIVVTQSTNQLTATTRPGGDRYEGTISDDQISATSTLHLGSVRCQSDISGTVLNDNLFTGTQLVECRALGAVSMVVCTFEATRRP